MKKLETLYKQFQQLKPEDQKKLKSKLLSDLFNAITIQDILVYEFEQTGELKKMWMGNMELPLNDVESLISGAKSLKTMAIWHVMLRTLKYSANRIIYEKSLNFDDILFGKALLYNINLMEKIVEDLLKLKVRKTLTLNEIKQLEGDKIKNKIKSF